MSALKTVFQGFTRSFMTTASRKSHGPEGFPGANLPLPIGNRYVVTAIFIAFFGSGLSVPYLILRHQLLK
ncbi:Cytochrome c oxidase subunit 7C, mitochondrial [Habropoda laboriosa]|uniref:Cytochrome c oxidase subunit 7C, mitochondrial n=1 Tax=Habropoda laboriosa TaxID=597456 RepID=A0A0L7R0L0_9HYME|nr:PREDICTED: cytochrome c oxidase subunit 7C, mitochondrial [Habropoda laboriosa]KOC64368.1 Cytochrome c oxidase subunit 7C, mitochondrial [Habropoda laboriosa]